MLTQRELEDWCLAARKPKQDGQPSKALAEWAKAIFTRSQVEEMLSDA